MKWWQWPIQVIAVSLCMVVIIPVALYFLIMDLIKSRRIKLYE